MTTTPRIRPRTFGLLLLAAALGLAVGAVGTWKVRSDAGVITAPVLDQVYPALETAATAFEAGLADGIGYRALQIPFGPDSVPLDQRGLGAYTEGAVFAARGYEQMNTVGDLSSTLAELRAVDGFARIVRTLQGGTELIRRSAVPVAGDPAPVWETVTTPPGMGVDVRSIRSIPTLLRTLAVQNEEAGENGIRRFSGTAPAASYPGAVASDLLVQTAPVLIVLVELDAQDRLVRILVRATNVLATELEYVTEIVFGPAGDEPAWVREARQ